MVQVMGTEHQRIAVASLGAAAAVVCIHLLWSAKCRRDRVCRTTAAVHPPALLNNAVLATRVAVVAATDRRPPEEGQVFSLYGGGEGEGEPSAPPMRLSESVLALLDLFDVDPVRGKCDSENFALQPPSRPDQQMPCITTKLQPRKHLPHRRLSMWQCHNFPQFLRTTGGLMAILLCGKREVCGPARYSKVQTSRTLL